jgi:hypothetical protein
MKMMMKTTAGTPTTESTTMMASPATMVLETMAAMAVVAMTMVMSVWFP